MEQGKSTNNPLGGVNRKAFVNAKDASWSIIMGSPTKEWGGPPSPGLMFLQTSKQDLL